MHIFLQNFVLIQPRTSPLKLQNLPILLTLTPNWSPAHTARRFEAPRFETLEECEEAYDKLLGVRPGGRAARATRRVVDP